MKRLALESRFFGALALALVCGGCAKKSPKPIHTAPWLAHPTSRAESDAALSAVHYALGDRSRIRFEVPSKGGTLHGTFERVHGEFSIEPSDLSRSHGRVEADLSALTLSPSADDDVDGGRVALSRVESALGVADAGAEASASFEVSALEDPSPSVLEAPALHDGGAPAIRTVRATAVGELLLHGFRVERRAPLEVQFGLGPDGNAPSTVVIRSRGPFVISLETHEIRVVEVEPRHLAPSGSAHRPREARVSVELYATKVE